MQLQLVPVKVHEVGETALWKESPQSDPTLLFPVHKLEHMYNIGLKGLEGEIAEEIERLRIFAGVLSFAYEDYLSLYSRIDNE